MLTAENITDEQIRELLAEIRRYDNGSIQRRQDMRACLVALALRPTARDVDGTIVTRTIARTRCAKILNAREIKP